MKLRLEYERGVAVLDVLEEVSVQNVTVLKAGITKLLKSGRNKIVLNLIDAKKLSMEVVKDIVNLQLHASELEGNIVLVGHGNMVKQAILSFATPPPIKYFSTVDAAVRSFAMMEKPKDETPENELKREIAKLEAENKVLKTKLQGRNVSDIKQLRYENTMLQKQVKIFEEQVQKLQKERKKPTDLASMAAKLQLLEGALEEVLKKEGLIS